MENISQINLPNNGNNPYNFVDTTLPHSSLSAISGGTDLSLVTTGEKYIWNSYSDTKVTQTAITTNANYEVLISGNADNTTRTQSANKCNKFLINPNLGAFKCTGNFTLEQPNMYWSSGYPVKTLKAVKLWSGSLTSGSIDITTPQHYNYFIIFVNMDGYKKSMVVPIDMISTLSLELHSSSGFISFKFIDSSPAQFSHSFISLEYNNRTSGTSYSISDLYGAN